MQTNHSNFKIFKTGALRETFLSQNVDLKPEVENAAGMLSYSERQMLFYLASKIYEGKGVIIDGGSFFGSSLVSSAAGLNANLSKEKIDFSKFPNKKPIHGFELGFLPAPKNKDINKKRVFGGVDYVLGESFVPILMDTISEYKDQIELKIGDLVEQVWPDSPIEICFIDVCKTATLNRHVSKQFYPNLIPNESWLINQDFFFDRLPWIKVTMGYLEEYFEWQGQIATSSIYKNIKEVPLEIANVDPYHEFELDECLKLHDKHPSQFLDRRYSFYMDLSKTYLIALKGTKDDALNYLEEIENKYEELLDDLDADRGNAFRVERARRQITNGVIFKVS